MKNSMKKIISLCLAATLCLSLCGFIGTASAETVTAYADSVLTAVTPTLYQGIKVAIITYDADGKEVRTEYKPLDAQKNEVFPFIIDGTTYLPIRAIAAIFGVDETAIIWDGYKNNVYLGYTQSADVAMVNPNAGTGTGVYAATPVDAYVGATIYANNTELVPVNEQQQVVPCYLINGTNYFPLRALTNFFLAGVTDGASYIGYEEATHTVLMYDPSTKAAAMADDTTPVDEESGSLIDQLLEANIKEDIKAIASKIRSQMLSYVLNPLSFVTDSITAVKDLVTHNENSENTVVRLIQGFKIKDIMALVSSMAGSGEISLDVETLIKACGGEDGFIRQIIEGVYEGFFPNLSKVIKGEYLNGMIDIEAFDGKIFGFDWLTIAENMASSLGIFNITNSIINGALGVLTGMFNR